MTFNPFCCSIEDSSRVVDGYMDGFRKNPMAEYGAAYTHGYNNGWNDREGVADDTQRALAQRYVASMNLKK